MELVTAIEWLFNYDIGFPTSMKSQGSASHFSSKSGGQLGKSSKSKSRGGCNGFAF